MGAWGTGLFADDTTCDVRDSYVKNLKAGLADTQAIKEVLDRFESLMGDPQIACLVYFALADTQWRYGRLDMHVKDRVLKLLNNGGDLYVWERDSPDDVSSRKKVLRDLKVRLESEQKPRRHIKVEIPKPPQKRTDAEHGTVFLLRLPDELYAALVLVGHCDTGYRTMEPVFLVLNWKGNSHPSIADLQGKEFLVIEGFILGPSREIGFFGENAKVNPISDFTRTSIIFPGAPLYSGKGSFTGKGGMISRIEKALSKMPPNNSLKADAPDGSRP